MIVRYEDGKWIYNIGVYFGILKDLNNDLIELIKYDAHYNENIEILFFNIANNISRLFPIRRRRINFNDWILKLEKHFDFLRDDYKKIFLNYKAEINLINDMRDKFEHVPHIIKWHQYIGNSKSKEMQFINDEYNLDIIEENIENIEIEKKNKEYLEWIINTDMLIDIIIALNEVFIKIQEKLKNILMVILKH